MNRNLLTIGLFTLAAASQASAATLDFFSNRALWLAQVTNLSNLTGGTETDGNLTSYNNATGLVFTNLQVLGFNITTGTSYELQSVNANAAQAYYEWGTGSIIRTGNKTDTNTIYARLTFPNPVSAFGFNFGAGGSAGAPASVTIAPGGLSPATVDTLQQPNFAFWGVVADSQTFSFADIYINGTGRYLVLDDIAQGSYSAAPEGNETAEPGTLLQIAMGGILLVMARRKFAGCQGRIV